MLHFSYHTKQIWTQMNALRQENDKLKDDMLQLWYEKFIFSIIQGAQKLSAIKF